MSDETIIGKFGIGHKVGILAYWHIGILAYWHIGILAYWLIVDTSADILLYHLAN